MRAFLRLLVRVVSPGSKRKTLQPKFFSLPTSKSWQRRYLDRYIQICDRSSLTDRVS